MGNLNQNSSITEATANPSIISSKLTKNKTNSSSSSTTTKTKTKTRTRARMTMKMANTITAPLTAKTESISSTSTTTTTTFTSSRTTVTTTSRNILPKPIMTTPITIRKLNSNIMVAQTPPTLASTPSRSSISSSLS